jgi:hypothetical protein
MASSIRAAASALLSQNITERKFIALFGSSSTNISKLWKVIFSKRNSFSHRWGAEQFLVTLHFLKTRSESLVGIACFWKLSKQTLMKYVHQTLKIFNQILPEVRKLNFLTKLISFQFDLGHQFKNWPFCVPSMIIDTFSCPIIQPPNEAWQYLSTKGKGWALKYEIGVSIGIPKVIWLSGPWKGCASDPTITFQSGIRKKIPKNESILADKIYKTDRYRFLVPLPGHRYSLDDEGRKFNYLIYSVRQSVERVIRRMRNFGFLASLYRSCDFKFHQLATRAIGKIVNFIFKFNPLG